MRLKKKKITSREIQTAVRLVLGGELSKHAVSEGMKAVTKLHNYKKESRNRISKSSICGLQFPGMQFGLFESLYIIFPQSAE